VECAIRKQANHKKEKGTAVIQIIEKKEKKTRVQTTPKPLKGSDGNCGGIGEKKKKTEWSIGGRGKPEEENRMPLIAYGAAKKREKKQQTSG